MRATAAAATCHFTTGSSGTRRQWREPGEGAQVPHRGRVLPRSHVPSAHHVLRQERAQRRGLHQGPLAQDQVRRVGQNGGRTPRSRSAKAAILPLQLVRAQGARRAGHQVQSRVSAQGGLQSGHQQATAAAAAGAAAAAAEQEALLQQVDYQDQRARGPARLQVRVAERQPQGGARAHAHAVQEGERARAAQRVPPRAAQGEAHRPSGVRRHGRLSPQAARDRRLQDTSRAQGRALHRHARHASGEQDLSGGERAGRRAGAQRSQLGLQCARRRRVLAARGPLHQGHLCNVRLALSTQDSPGRALQGHQETHPTQA